MTLGVIIMLHVYPDYIKIFVYKWNSVADSVAYHRSSIIYSFHCVGVDERTANTRYICIHLVYKLFLRNRIRIRRFARIRYGIYIFLIVKRKLAFVVRSFSIYLV